jgi:hypothetical protein
MTHRELLLYWTTVGFELLLCGLVYSRNLQRRLPFFAGYSTLLLGCTVGVAAFYLHFGFRSVESYNAYWITTGLIVLARSFAVAELCRYELRAYRGIWALSWRILTFLTLLFIGHAVMDAWGQPNRISIYGLTFERDFGICSIAVLLAMLAIRNYYGVTLPPLEKRVALGLCIVWVIDIINNSVLRYAYTEYLSFWFFTKYTPFWAEMKSEVEGANNLWGTIRASGDFISMGIWCYSLRKPLPAPARDPVLLPAEVYRELSPVVNLRLRAINDRLLEMLKP